MGRGEFEVQPVLLYMQLRGRTPFIAAISQIAGNFPKK
jgi:hypothetical protein